MGGIFSAPKAPAPAPAPVTPAAPAPEAASAIQKRRKAAEGRTASTTTENLGGNSDASKKLLGQ
jgi:hypothetical protein